MKETLARLASSHVTWIMFNCVIILLGSWLLRIYFTEIGEGSPSDEIHTWRGHAYSTVWTMTNLSLFIWTIGVWGVIKHAVMSIAGRKKRK